MLLFSFFFKMAVQSQDCKDTIYSYQKKKFAEFELSEKFDTITPEYVDFIYQHSFMSDSNAQKRKADLLAFIKRETANISPLEDPHIYWMLDMYVRALEPYLKKYLNKSNVQVCYGSMPNNDINAYNEIVGPHNRVIIFNRLLFTFLNDFIKIGFTPVLLEYNRMENEDAIIDYSEKRLKRLLMAFSKADYVDERTDTLFDGYMMLPKEFAPWSFLLIDGCEKFIMCHEYAHAILGHTLQNTTQTDKIWKDELDADILGYSIYESYIENDTNAFRRQLRSAYLCAPIFLFTSFNILEESNALINHNEQNIFDEKQILNALACIKVGKKSVQINAVKLDRLNEFKGIYPPAHLRETILYNYFIAPKTEGKKTARIPNDACVGLRAQWEVIKGNANW